MIDNFILNLRDSAYPKRLNLGQLRATDNNAAIFVSNWSTYQLHENSRILFKLQGILHQCLFCTMFLILGSNRSKKLLHPSKLVSSLRVGHKDITASFKADHAQLDSDRYRPTWEPSRCIVWFATTATMFPTSSQRSLGIARSNVTDIAVSGDSGHLCICPHVANEVMWGHFWSRQDEN